MKTRKRTFSKNLAISVTAFFFAFTLVAAGLICMFPDSGTVLLGLYTAFMAVPTGTILSYYKNSRTENVEKIKLNPTFMQSEDEGGDI